MSSFCVLCSGSVSCRSDSRILSCLHSVCVGCLPQLLKGSANGSVKCPECETVTDLSQSGRQLRCDVTLMKVEPVSRSLNEKKPSVCGNCEKKEAVCGCTECENENGGPGVPLCDACSESHGKLKVLKFHKVLPWNLFVQWLRSGGGSNNDDDTCERHNQRLAHYCRTCKSLQCPACISECHVDHDTCTAEEGVKLVKGVMKATTAAMASDQELLRKEIKRQQDLKSGCLDAVKRQHNKIDEDADALIALVNQSRLDAHHRLSNAVAAPFHGLDESIERSSVLFSKLSACGQFAIRASELESPSDVVASSNALFAAIRLHAWIWKTMGSIVTMTTTTSSALNSLTSGENEASSNVNSLTPKWLLTDFNGPLEATAFYELTANLNSKLENIRSLSISNDSLLQSSGRMLQSFSRIQFNNSSNDRVTGETQRADSADFTAKLDLEMNPVSTIIDKYLHGLSTNSEKSIAPTDCGDVIVMGCGSQSSNCSESFDIGNRLHSRVIGSRICYGKGALDGQYGLSLFDRSGKGTDAYIVQGHQICHIDVTTGKSICIFGDGQGSAMRSLNGPRGLVRYAPTSTQDDDSLTGSTLGENSTTGLASTAIIKPTVEYCSTLFVADFYNHRIQVYHESAGKAVRSIGGGHGAALGQLNGPYGLALYISRSTDGGTSIAKSADSNNTSPSRNTLHRTSSSSPTPSVAAYSSYEISLPMTATKAKMQQQLLVAQTQDPRDLVLLFVSDSNNHRIQVFNAATGVCLRSIGDGKGDEDGQLNCPYGLALTKPSCFAGKRSTPFLFVADWGNNRVSVFNGKSGAFLRNFGGIHQTGTQQFAGPYGLSFQQRTPAGATEDLPPGLLYVSEHGRHVISVVDVLLGTTVQTIGLGLGGGPGQLSSPTDVQVWVEGDGNVVLYVWDSGNRRIQAFSLGYATASY